MHYIHVGVVNQVHKVMIAGNFAEACLLGHIVTPVKTGLVNVAESNQAVRHFEVMAAANAAEAYDTLCQLVAWSDITFAAKDVARQDGERSCCCCAL